MACMRYNKIIEDMHMHILYNFIIGLIVFLDYSSTGNVGAVALLLDASE